MDGLFLLVFGALLAVALMVAFRLTMTFPAQRPGDYEHLGPDFDLTRHLSGPLVSEGVIYGPTGRVTSRFVADMFGEWHGTEGVLQEAFRYDSGATQVRAWHLSLDADGGGGFDAEAEDLIGRGRGRACGAAVQFCYRIRLPADAGGHVLDVIDWMYLIDDGTIINRSQFRKFGILVAELVATMKRRDPL